MTDRRPRSPHQYTPKELEIKLGESKVITIPYTLTLLVPVGDGILEFKHVDPKNSDYLCLYHSFARGYYGTQNYRNAKCNLVIDRMRDLYAHVRNIEAHPDHNAAREARGKIYQDMQEASALEPPRSAIYPKDLDESVQTGEWGAEDNVQILADAFDVEVIVWVPWGLKEGRAEDDPPIPEEWQVTAYGAPYAPDRQIHLINWMNRGHWTLLKPTKKSAKFVFQSKDPKTPTEELRAPIRSTSVHEPLVRLPEGHVAYENERLVPKDKFHLPDFDPIKASVDIQHIESVAGKSQDGKGQQDKQTVARMTRSSSRANRSSEGVTAAPQRLADTDSVVVPNELSFYYHPDPGNPILRFNRIQANLTPTSGLYKAFAQVYYGDEAKWEQVRARVLGLWNAVMNANRADNPTRRARRALYTAMDNSLQDVATEISRAEIEDIGLTQLIADAYGVSIFMHVEDPEFRPILKWRGDCRFDPSVRQFHLRQSPESGWEGLSPIGQDTNPLEYLEGKDVMQRPLHGEDVPKPLQRLPNDGGDAEAKEEGLPDDRAFVEDTSVYYDDASDDDESDAASPRRSKLASLRELLRDMTSGRAGGGLPKSLVSLSNKLAPGLGEVDGDVLPAPASAVTPPGRTTPKSNKTVTPPGSKSPTAAKPKNTKRQRDESSSSEGSSPEPSPGAQHVGKRARVASAAPLANSTVTAPVSSAPANKPSKPDTDKGTERSRDDVTNNPVVKPTAKIARKGDQPRGDKKGARGGAKPGITARGPNNGGVKKNVKKTGKAAKPKGKTVPEKNDNVTEEDRLAIEEASRPSPRPTRGVKNAPTAPAAPAATAAPSTTPDDISCNCKTGCQTRRCACKKSDNQCGPRCHKGDDCQNKDDHPDAGAGTQPPKTAGVDKSQNKKRGRGDESNPGPAPKRARGTRQSPVDVDAPAPADPSVPPTRTRVTGKLVRGTRTSPRRTPSPNITVLQWGKQIRRERNRKPQGRR